MVELEIKYDKLTRAEAKKLKGFMRAKHGNVKIASDKTELSVNTLKRATCRLEVTSKNAESIRRFLNSEAALIQT